MALTKVSRGLLSTGIVDNSNATAITIDSSENVGIGTSSPSSYFAGATNLVLSGTGDSGLTINSGTSSTSRIHFADGTSGNDRYRGYVVYVHTDDSMQFATSGTERMRIDSSGNVGIGTGVAPGINGSGLSIFDALYPRLTFRNDTTGDSSAATVGTSAYLVGDNFYLNNQEAGILSFGTNATERMRIDSSGNLLVGKTSTGDYVTGIEMQPAGAILSYRTGGVASIFGRTDDGEITRFTRGNSIIGSIGVVGGNNLYIHGDTIGLGIGDDNIYPTNSSGTSTDAITDLGDSSARFRNVYRSGSTISTSDRNMKQDIRDLTDAERSVAVAAKGLLKAFRFIDRVEQEGDSASIHFGIIAQDLASAFTAEGLDANDYQVYRADTFTDDDGNEQTRLGICYENLLAFIISAI